MPRKKTKVAKVKKTPKKRFIGIDDNVKAIQVGSTEEIHHLSAMMLVDRIVEKGKEINRITDELEGAQGYRESAIEQLKLTSFASEGFSVHFGWHDAVDAPMALITLNAPDRHGEIASRETSLEELRSLACWLNEQLDRSLI